MPDPEGTRTDCRAEACWAWLGGCGVSGDGVRTGAKAGEQSAKNAQARQEAEARGCEAGEGCYLPADMSSKPDDDIGDVWRAIKAQRQEKRASNRVSSAQLLLDAGIQFENRNGGAHLIVYPPRGGVAVDFWPGPGKWAVRGDNTTNFGVHRLLEFCKDA